MAKRLATAQRGCLIAALLCGIAVRASTQTADVTVTIQFGDLNTDCYPSCAHPTEWLQQLSADVRDSTGAAVSTTGMLFDWGVDFCGNYPLQYGYATGVDLRQIAVDGNLVKITPDCCPTCAHQAYRVGVRVSLGEWMATAQPVLVPNIPVTHAILQNFPNPFNARTRIPFEIKARSHVRLEIVDLQGRGVAQLADRTFAPGRHAVDWSPHDIASGTYLGRIIVTSAGEPTVMMSVKMVFGK